MDSLTVRKKDFFPHAPVDLERNLIEDFHLFSSKRPLPLLQESRHAFFFILGRTGQGMQKRLEGKPGLWISALASIGRLFGKPDG